MFNQNITRQNQVKNKVLTGIFVIGKMQTPEAAASLQGCKLPSALSVDRRSTPEAAASPASVVAVIIHFRGLCPLAELKLSFTPTSFLQCKKEAKKTFAASPLLFFFLFCF